MGGNLEVTVSSGDVFDVREFTIHERMSSIFDVTLHAVCENPDVDFDAVVGQPARFVLHTGPNVRFWSGICNDLSQVRVEERGVSTYRLNIVPTLWLLTQRRNHRMFQQLSEPDIVLQILSEWGIEPELKIDKGAYKKRKYRVQYAESDHAFISRMLEDAGISYYFTQSGDETKLVLSDAPHANAPRPVISFRDTPTVADREHVTNVRVGQRVRPGRYVLRDHDYRRPPSYNLAASAAKPRVNIEDRLERFHYTPGAFLFGVDRGEDTPNADDKGKARTDESEAATLAAKRLDAKRSSGNVVSFETNVHDLAPGVVASFMDHPRSDLAPGKKLLIVESLLAGTPNGEWHHACESRRAESPYRPALVTPKPKATGVESATVVGPPGEEIHCDEFGRVRVHFHWDRESRMDDNSSCWIHVSHPWGGAGFGGMNIPRVGQEVIVDFLGGDPDRPVIIGRVYTNLQKVPYKLPDNKTQSGWKSNSTTNTGGYNELMFEDAAGKELLRMQAERDMSTLVKNDQTTTVRHNRSTVVLNDDLEVVVGFHTQNVGKDRTVAVLQNQMHAIKKNVVQHSLEGFAYHKSKQFTLIESDEQIILKVGDKSFIRILPEGIVIQGPKVLINPNEGE
ncbi:type VI secretion system Vgr family protein [Polyangium spumosum]|uniref:Type VI secretion system tip protein VgrG n=1 Tax=Polyangium spumosum TaxID=889282 RepID=A0A6N7PMI4_9BACT|nr:type VI secretion system tip protein TssI/VgrG [Polyangium spumosum]MRG92977.1 type VI secretion system tip protein VgrG [Polyangium spumosum]